MPAPLIINVNNMNYSVPILNGEMDDVANQILSKREQILEINNQFKEIVSLLNNLQLQFLSQYIQQTGSFPTSGNN